MRFRGVPENANKIPRLDPTPPRLAWQMNILISGGTSIGKTTFARSLLSMVDPGERILTIEDAYELFPRQANAVALKADRSTQGERTPARLLAASLRIRPDRIILRRVAR
jgi:type IV secretion system protein VirB11